MSDASFRTKQDNAKIWKQNVTATSVAVATTKFLFGMCDCTVDKDVGKGGFLLMLETLHLCEHSYMLSHMSPGMDCPIQLSQKTLTPTEINRSIH